MLDKETVVKITNRDSGRVGYAIPEMGNLQRVFAPGETKEVTMEELRKLSWLPGGSTVIQNYFIIDNKEAVTELIPNVEPEYYYTEADVKNLLLTGSLDELLDCLDFAPEGTINLVKNLAVDLKINDIAKRDAILKKTGFNVNSAIMVNEETAEENPEEVKTRRTATPSVATASTGRRVTTSKYKVTSIQE